MSEFDTIRRLLRDAPLLRKDVTLGPGDDAAVLAVPAGFELVVTTDTLISGRHFPEDTPPGDIGWKSLAASLSDLAAMAADPAWITIAMSLPEADERWMSEFVDGLFALLRKSGASLVGGDLVRGPLSITVQACGLVPIGKALRRDRARAGDSICVTGDLGDAALGLAQWRGPERPQSSSLAYLQQRLARPTPRNDAGSALRSIARAGIDISDGLVADLGHMLDASGVGARLYAEALPSSQAFDQCADAGRRLAWQLAGGDDYELCLMIARERVEEAAAAAGCKFTIIGECVAEPGLQLLDSSGEPMSIPDSSYDHFAGLT